MTTSTTIRSGDQALRSSAALTMVLIGCCSAGTVGGVGGHSYAFDPGSDVSASLGAGPLADQCYAALGQTGKRVLAMPATPTWSPAPSIVHVGSGPTVTCALAGGASGCYDDYKIVITPTVGGAGGVAQATVAYDGVTPVETIVIPAEPPPSLLGSVDLTGITLSTLDATTLIFTAPAAFTATFTSPTSVEDIAAQITAQAISGSSVIRAEIAQTAAGAKKLRLYTTSGGAGVTLTVSASSTGEVILGFTSGAGNLTATGSAATLTLPNTGITFTFPSGTYAKGDTYTAQCIGPRASLSAIITAANAAAADYPTNPFGFFSVAQPADTAANCAALQAALAAVTAGLVANTTAPLFVTSVVGSPFHSASPVLATNDANIATADAALLAAFASSSANLDSVAVGDVYYQGSSDLRFGFFRRSATLAWAIQRATAAKIAADVGDGLLTGASLLAPDGLTRARDDGRATTHLGRGDGPGFSALRSTSGGLGAPKFLPGATRARASSRLRYAGVVGVALEIARIVFATIEPWEAQTPPTNPLTGMMDDREKERRANLVAAILVPTLTPRNGLANVTSYTVSILDPVSGRFVDNGQTRVRVSFAVLGEIEDVIVEISAAGIVVS